MELEVLTKEDAEAKPAGRARDEPNENPRLKPPECVYSNSNNETIISRVN